MLKGFKRRRGKRMTISGNERIYIRPRCSNTVRSRPLKLRRGWVSSAIFSLPLGTVEGIVFLILLLFTRYINKLLRGKEVVIISPYFSFFFFFCLNSLFVEREKVQISGSGWTSRWEGGVERRCRIELKKKRMFY